MSDENYVLLGDVIHENGLGTTQYTSRYTHGVFEFDGYPNLCQGLRLLDISTDRYHSTLIHKDDAEKFAQRVREFYLYMGNLFNLTQQLLATQSALNSGRGVNCISEIVRSFSTNHFCTAKAVCFHEADKISNYTELVALIKQLFWSWEDHPWSALELMRAEKSKQKL